MHSRSSSQPVQFRPAIPGLKFPWPLLKVNPQSPEPIYPLTIPELPSSHLTNSGLNVRLLKSRTYRKVCFTRSFKYSKCLVRSTSTGDCIDIVIQQLQSSTTALWLHCRCFKHSYVIEAHYEASVGVNATLYLCSSKA